jgi:hypothetical protein
MTLRYTKEPPYPFNLLEEDTTMKKYRSCDFFVYFVLTDILLGY